jgi:hypothetical protein
MTSYTYLYHQKYGSDEVDTMPVKISSAKIEGNGAQVRLKCEGLRPGYVHELRLGAMKSASYQDLAHADAYYTLNKIPQAP